MADVPNVQDIVRDGGLDPLINVNDLIAGIGDNMAKQASDTTPAASVTGLSTMSILTNASASAKPPTAKYTSSSLPQNKR